MKNTSWIALAVLLATLVAGAVAWRLHTAQSGLAAADASGDSPQQQAGMPKHLRRLLATRLGRPRVLRIQRVRTVRDPQYSGVACGEVAWGDTPVAAADFKRFVASKRTVHIDGAAGFDAIWNKVCVPR